MGRSAHLFYFVLPVVGLFVSLAVVSGCDGKADLPKAGTHLGDSVVDPGSGGSRSDLDPGQLYIVTKIVEATSDIPSWVNADLPFNTPRRQLGTVATDSQWPFEFTYSYPSNNYALTEARMLLVTSRDSSDTEGIFIDGILTGRPPGTMVSNTTTKVTHRFHSCQQAACPAGIVLDPPPNNFFLDWAYKHYKVSTQNTFDIDLTNVLAGTVLTLSDLIQDGLLQVVTGDDAVVQTDSATASRPLLVLTGSTYSVGALTCSTSPTYKLINDYLHNDGNSIAAAAFTGSVLTPFTSYATAYTTFRSVEFYFDPRLPTLSDYSLLNITKANLLLRVKRAAGPTALVINGIGIDQDGFDRNTADSNVVESWSEDLAVRGAWNTFINAIPSNATQQDVTLNLLTLLGADAVKSLLLQGKLNIAVAGPIARIYGQAATSTRTYGTQVAGPELILEGNYAAEICEVPDNPNSPLNGGGGGPAICSGPDADVATPTLSSIQVINITSSSATIQWLSNEAATTQVGYGLISPSTLTTLDTNLTTFHSVNVTGLQPYKYYQYNTRSVDACGNEIISATKSFRTLR